LWEAKVEAGRNQLGRYVSTTGERGWCLDQAGGGSKGGKRWWHPWYPLQIDPRIC